MLIVGGGSGLRMWLLQVAWAPQVDDELHASLQGHLLFAPDDLDAQ